ncbi:hypothetical protein OOZ15_12915 [Galbibacter sp. EGI 63066]|uniref:hypothetical protein n=1 Tax=Galbibacter sp. EGI 63066 TaxID=2993559 RepID=UPI0022492BD9|nr:hypothetical protein [Galbibacter sp. EGI 63066]MCX2680848.1 hypothetical protein [Galbibacter sp. EGI 63066]
MKKWRKATSKPKKIEFSETDRIGKYEHIAVDFFDKIIGIDFYDCFVSDESSLYDFDSEFLFDLENDEILKKIKSEYGIVPKSEACILVDIFEQIEGEADG